MLEYYKNLTAEKIKNELSFFDEDEEEIIDIMLNDYGLEFLEDTVHLAINTNWMNDNKAVIKEDISYYEIDDIDNLIATFEDGWSETDYFRINVYLPIFRKVHDSALQVMDRSEVYILETITELTYEIINSFFWEPYHEAHNTYEIASKLLREAQYESKTV